ncbi:mCG13775, isoform CRA_c, partial [Mus musculus]
RPQLKMKRSRVTLGCFLPQLPPCSGSTGLQLLGSWPQLASYCGGPYWLLTFPLYFSQCCLPSPPLFINRLFLKLFCPWVAGRGGPASC